MINKEPKLFTLKNKLEDLLSNLEHKKDELYHILKKANYK